MVDLSRMYDCLNLGAVCQSGRWREPYPADTAFFTPDSAARNSYLLCYFSYSNYRIHRQHVSSLTLSVKVVYSSAVFLFDLKIQCQSADPSGASPGIKVLGRVTRGSLLKSVLLQLIEVDRISRGLEGGGGGVFGSCSTSFNPCPPLH